MAALMLVRTLLCLITLAGLAQALWGLVLVRRFALRPLRNVSAFPAVTILKPVYGAETLLEAAIASFCAQDYPLFQLVIGAQDATDPALEVARKLQADYPNVDISIVVDPRWHGANGKINNLINMLPAAKHDVLVIADSDLHVRPDYLRAVVAELQQPGTGLVTSLSGGEAIHRTVAGQLGASHLSHIAMPNALIAEALGRQDCLGGTMALRRETLARAGGLEAIMDQLADDNVLGQLVRRQGLAVRLANTLPVVTVQEVALPALWQHELRWARTIRSLEPLSHAGCVIQYPIFWAFLAVLISGGALWALACLALAWGGRALIAWQIEVSLAARRARAAAPVPAWLLPARDLLSVMEIIASFLSDDVVWRGRKLKAARVRQESLVA